MGLGYEALVSKPRTIQNQFPGSFHKWELGLRFCHQNHAPYTASSLEALTNGTRV